MGRALSYLQSLRRIAPLADGADMALIDSATLAAPLSSIAVAQLVVPSNVQVSAAASKLSLVPALLAQLEYSLGLSSSEASRTADTQAALLPYMDPARMFGGGPAVAEGLAFDGLYGYGIVLLQLLTEQQPAGLLGAVAASLAAGNLGNLVPRTPAAGAESEAVSEELARLAMRCCSQQGASSSAPGASPCCLPGDVLPALEALRVRLAELGPAAMSWDQVEELMMLPLQPRTSADATSRRWVRQDFKMRRKLFLEEVAKLAVEGPIHKIEVRRSRCFKDSVATFSGKVRARARAWRLCSGLHSPC